MACIFHLYEGAHRRGGDIKIVGFLERVRIGVSGFPMFNNMR